MCAAGLPDYGGVFFFDEHAMHVFQGRLAKKALPKVGNTDELLLWLENHIIQAVVGAFNPKPTKEELDFVSFMETDCRDPANQA